MNRRAVLTTGGLALLGLGLGGCASRTARPSRARPVLNLPPPDVSWDRVIRTTVGLRPHRPSGFLLKAERLDGKTVIHNYGHGGAGISLSWGTGQMAAEMALEHLDRRAAVVGCGAVGLAAARQLQRRGFDVTIYAMAVPPDTTSNMALAGFTPTSGLVDRTLRTPAWEAQFRRAAEIAYRQLQLMAGSRYGVSWIDGYDLMDEPPTPAPAGEPGLLPASLRTGAVLLDPGQHPFRSRYASRGSDLRIEPSIYLDALVQDFLLFGGRIVLRKFETTRALMTLGESLIVNCTGLGSRALFGDEELTPLKGQLTVLVPQSEVTYRTSGGIARRPGEEQPFFFHMMPRADGIALGGTSERGVWTLEPNDGARQRIVDGHIDLFASMRRPTAALAASASQPPTAPPPLESFFDRRS